MANQADIDQAIAEAAAAELKAGNLNFSGAEILERVNEAPDVEQRVTSTAEDSVTIFSTKDGMPSEIPTYMLGKHLRARWQQRHVKDDNIPQELVGKAVWSLQPVKEFRRGEQKCWLHPESPERALADEAGLVGIECRKETLRSELDVSRHVEHKHHDEYEAIERHRTRAEERRRQETLERLLREAIRKDEDDGS